MGKLRKIDWRYVDWPEVGMFALLGSLALTLVLLLAWGIPAMVKHRTEWDAWCVAQGGHVIHHTSTSSGVAVGPKGSITPVTSSETTYYCLSSTGGILAID